MIKKVMVVSAHPDDEALGCGGTLWRWANAGAHVETLFMTNGVGARNTASEEAEKRQQAARQAASILGIQGIYFLDYPDNQLDSVPLLALIQAIEQRISAFRPDTVITHHWGDLNIDHRKTHQAVLTACRPQRGHPVKQILCFEVPSSTEWSAPNGVDGFQPNWFVDIQQAWPHKQAALQAYQQELRPWPHPRSLRGIEALASWRGGSVGFEKAEAFCLVRALQ